jgi:branched-chain amino acid transport system permease protein
MSDQMMGYSSYAITLLTMIAIYGVMGLGLNLNWGVTGLFNVGIAGFFAIGAYTAAIMTTEEASKHLGGFDMPFWVGAIAAMITSAIIAFFVGKICIRLRSDYLAIATIGIAEILRLILKNEMWATNGARGISNIPKPFESLGGLAGPLAFLALVLSILLVVYLLLERGQHSPWGRIMRAIRDNELAARASGKNVERLRLEAFIIGSSIMGLGGALSAHYFKFIGIEATEPLLTTFLVWVMMIVGGSGNNKGVLLGALIIWSLWSMSEMVIQAFSLTGEFAVRVPYMRMFIIGLVLNIVLQKWGAGILPERHPGGKDAKPKR